MRGPGKRSIELRGALFKIIEEQQPATVRQAYYQVTVHHLLPKTEPAYRRVGRDAIHDECMVRGGSVCRFKFKERP